MHHRLDVRVAEFGGLLHAPFEGLVVVTDEFKVNANVDFAHRNKLSVGLMDYWIIGSLGLQGH
jgi:hypothetical protein